MELSHVGEFDGLKKSLKQMTLEQIVEFLSKQAIKYESSQRGVIQDLAEPVW
jgi:hypothetical protein